MGPAAFQKTGDFVAARTRGGVEVFVLPTRKFKTKLVRIHMRARSSEQNAARALVPNLLRRGTRKCPSMALVSRAFESLYGSSWSSSVYKLGHDQITSIRLETVEERFLPGKPAIFKPALELTRELLFEPNLVGGQFPRDVFEQERLNHRRDIEAQYNTALTGKPGTRTVSVNAAIPATVETRGEEIRSPGVWAWTNCGIAPPGSACRARSPRRWRR